MTKIEELFDEAVSAAPPSRLTIGDVFGAARARRRRARATLASLASLAIAAGSLVAIAGVNLAGGNAANPPAGTAPPGPVVWAGRADASHLYVVTNVCGINPRLEPSAVPSAPSAGPAPLCNRLSSSSDGGATWVTRAPMEPDEVAIVGPQSLLRHVVPPLVTPTVSADDATSPSPVELSTDGGATWTPLPEDGPDTDAVPPGGVVLGLSGVRGVRVFDPALGRIRSLTGGPQLLNVADLVMSGPPGSVGAIWAAGVDPATGRPAVAVSHNRGKSWSTRVLPNTAALLDPATADGAINGQVPVAGGWSAQHDLVSGDEDTAYVTMFDRDAAVRTPSPAIPGTAGYGWLRGFRTTDGGATWAEVDAAAVVPSYTWAWVTTDGRLVLAVRNQQVDGATIDEVVVSADGGRTYALASPPGLPPSLLGVDGWVAYTDHGVYVTEDGWTWREAWHDS